MTVRAVTIGAQPYAGVGAVEAHVLAQLAGYAQGGLGISLAARSPLGPGAIRVRAAVREGGAAVETCRMLERWLHSQSWVEAVAIRPPNVYVRVTAWAQRAWVTHGFTVDRARGREGDGRPVTVRFVDPRAAQSRSLHGFREAAVGRSVFALLASRGFEVAHEPTARVEGALTVELPEGQRVLVPVAGVDLPHGPLRARLGGAAEADELVRDLCDRASATTASGDEPHGADAVLRFVLLRTDRSRRVQLDDARLRGEHAAFDAVLAARRAARGDSPRAAPAGDTAPTGDTGDTAPAGDTGDRAVRELVTEIDVLPSLAARAAGQLEPALLARYARSLSEKLTSAAVHLSAEDPLRSVAVRALDATLALLGVEPPRPTEQERRGAP